jgi:hypothetical protein
MSARVRRIVVFPRYTSFVGSGSIYSPPLDVRGFASGVFVGWQGTGLGLTPAEVEYTFQLSPDLENWFDTTVLSPGAGAEVTGNVGFDYPWMRCRADVSGADPAVTGWIVGEIVERDGLGAGGGA